MLSVIHHAYGDPAQVLQAIEVPDVGPPSANQVRIRVTHVPIHPGDLLGVAGSPAFGPPATIGHGGRTPGFEGAGIVEKLGEGVDPAAGLQVGTLVAFFPVEGAWSERILAPAGAVVPLPTGIPGEVGAQMLINTITASLLARAAQAALPGDGSDATVIQTGAGSAVGRLLTVLALERGVTPVRLVRSRESAKALERKLPGVPTFATEEDGWQNRVRREIGKRQVPVAFDSVGGSLFADVAGLMTQGGTIFSYGSLGGSSADIRSVAPRSLTVRGITLGTWMGLPAVEKNTDIATAQRLALNRQDQFELAGTYPAGRIAEAVEHVRRRGKTGTIVLGF